MHVLRRAERSPGNDALIPVVIRVQQLQKRLLSAEHTSLFSSACNWADAHLQITHGADSERYDFHEPYMNLT